MKTAAKIDMIAVKEDARIPKIAIGTSPRQARARQGELVRMAKKDRSLRKNKVVNNRAEVTGGG